MLKPSLQLKLSQQLTMTPQLQQAIRLLQLPVMELQTQIQTALDENLMLEVEEPESSADDPEDFADAEPEAEVAVAAEADWEDTQKTGPSEAPKSSDPRTTVEYADRSEETLRDHLLWQLELENLDARTTAIGQAVIDAINDDGYLTDDLETIRATLAPDVLVSIEDVEQVLVKLVQQFDPAGIGARSVSECVQLQLAYGADVVICLDGAFAARRGASVRRAETPSAHIGRGARGSHRARARVSAAARRQRVHRTAGVRGTRRVRAPPRRSMGGGAQQFDVAAATRESALRGLARKGRGV